jgi:glyoxylase-like metal-dependent hydrolase (beta-lactamase superfamily II)
MIKVKKIVSSVLDENCYIVYDPESLCAVVIDPGGDDGTIIFEIEKKGLKPEIIVNTHGHYDHIFSDDKLRFKFQIPLAVYKTEVEMLSDSYKNGSEMFGMSITVKKPDILLEDNQEINLSFGSFKVLHTPGHTVGGICLLFDEFLVTGDTLFAGTIGRTDFDGGNYEDMLLSLSRIKKIVPSSISIYPGHGSRTTLTNELQHNPYLQ